MERWNAILIDETIIGIDHGFGNIKTRNCCFSNGIARVSDSPITYDNILEFEGKCYQTGGDRNKVQDSKVSNENYRLITFAAVAKELKAMVIFVVKLISSKCYRRIAEVSSQHFRINPY